MRDGLNPTRLVLPHAPADVARWSGALEYLLHRFPDDVPRLLEKVAAGEVVDGRGVPVDAGTPYEPRGFLFLYRDPPPDEPPVPGEVEVLHRDENLLVVDKPHLLATIPRGRWVTQTVLVRLRRALDLPDLAPAHRLDRPTAGVLVLTVRPAVRGAYQELFARREVHKVYEAVAPLRADLDLPVTVRSRIVKERGVPRAQEVPGPVNAESRVELAAADHARGLGLYRLVPRTGRTHQLRVHMASLGVPILHDPFWPELRDDAADDHARPLQLLSRSLAFTDPLDGRERRFVSRRTLAAWDGAPAGPDVVPPAGLTGPARPVVGSPARPPAGRR